MTFARCIGAVLLAALLCVAPAAAEPVGPAVEQMIQGIARDALGNVLEGVEVLILSEISGLPPLAAVHTGTDGRFHIAGLSPGVYRVAAIKQGYRTYLGRVNTLIGSSLELLLHTDLGPTSESGELILPADASWALRVPRRSILRDVGAAAASDELIADAVPRRRGSAALDVMETLALRLDQVFFLGENVHVGDTDATGLEGSETLMELASAIGPRGNIALRGNRERLTGPLPRVAEDGRASHESSALALDFSYATGPDANVAVRAFYAEHGLDFGSPGGEPAAAALGQFQRAWGYDAAWSMQLDPVSRLSVKVDYLDSSAALAESLPGAGRGQLPLDGHALSNMRIGAQGTYESVPLDRHQLRVGFRAQFAELPAGAARPTAPAAVTPFVDGWSLRINAEDRWTVAAPVTLVYGLGYRHAMSDTGSSLIVPRFGGIWSDDWVSLRLLLSYHEITGWGDPLSGTGSPAAEPRQPVGYDATVEIPLVASLRLVGEASYQSMQFDTVVDEWELAALASPLFVTDGNAANSRTALALSHQSERATTRLELARGVAEGRLASLPAFGTPIQFLSDNRLRYRKGSMGVRLVPSGTDLALEYRRVEEAPLGGELFDPAFLEESVELRLIQELIRLRQTGSSWRLLLALRVASVEEAEEAESDPTALAGPLASANRLSAGVSVSF